MIRKCLFLSFLGLIMFHTSIAQSTIAKLKYKDAEEAYNKSDYTTALNKLNEAEKLFGKVNPPIVYLRIVAQDKMVSSSKSVDPNLMAALMKNTAFYLKEYEHTKGIEDKYKEVYKLNEKLSELSNAKIIAELPEYYQAKQYYDERKYSEAMAWYLKAASKGNTGAMVGIGSLYYNGSGVDRSYFKAMEWFLKAAEKGDPKAMTTIASMYESGNGVAAQSYQTAINWYFKAASQKDPEAIFNIGRYYEEGRSVPQNYEDAYMSYLAAALYGYPPAMKKLIEMYISGKGTEKDKTRAEEWQAKYDAAVKKQ